MFGMHMHVYVLMCVGVHVYMSVCACGCLRMTSEVFFNHSLSYLLKQGDTLSPVLTDDASIASQLALGVSSTLGSQADAMPACL